jgi:hypothetical protein
MRVFVVGWLCSVVPEWAASLFSGSLAAIGVRASARSLSSSGVTSGAAFSVVPEWSCIALLWIVGRHRCQGVGSFVVIFWRYLWRRLLCRSRMGCIALLWIVGRHRCQGVGSFVVIFWRYLWRRLLCRSRRSGLALLWRFFGYCWWNPCLLLLSQYGPGVVLLWSVLMSIPFFARNGMMTPAKNPNRSNAFSPLLLCAPSFGVPRQPGEGVPVFSPSGKARQNLVRQRFGPPARVPWHARRPSTGHAASACAATSRAKCPRLHVSANPCRR